MKATFEVLKDSTEKTLVELMVMAEDKYTAAEIGKVKRVQYTDCIGYDVLSGEDGRSYAAEMGCDGEDEHDEYLVLKFEDGSTSTFRNSHVDLFVLSGCVIKLF